MTHPVRVALVGSIVLGILAVVSGCNATVTPTPSVSVSTLPPTTTPSATPSKTYGPNATAALTAVAAYYAWINKYSQDPTHPYFLDLNRVAKGEALSTGMSTVNLMAVEGQRQIGDLVVVDMVPDGESASKISVAVCLDSSKATRVDMSGQTIPPADSLTRRAYTAILENESGWYVTSARGGMTSC